MKNYEPVFDLITNYAKTQFDYESFVGQADEETADFLLFHIIALIAAGESKELMVSRLIANLMMNGFFIEEKLLTEFVNERSMDLGLSILAYRIATDNMNYGAAPGDVFVQIQEFFAQVG